MSKISKDDFSLLVADALCKKGIDGKTLHIDQNDFAVRPKDELGRIVGSFNLANSYVAYCNSETDEKKNGVIQRLIGLWFEPVEIKSFEEMKDKIFPVIRERRFYPKEPTSKILAGHPQLVLGNHVTTLLALDEADYIVPVTNAHLETWSKSWEEALDAAFDNMSQRPPMTWQVEENDAKPEDCIYTHESDDPYGSSNLIFPSTIRELEVLGTPIIFAPAKSILLVTGSECIYGLRRALEIIAECEDRADYLCPEMLGLDEFGNYFPCELTPDHELFDEFEKLRIMNNLIVYTACLEELEGSFEQVVNTKTIVPYEVFESDGRYYEEVHLKTNVAPLILPFAETIVVETSNGSVPLSSSKFAELVGESMTMISEYPLLYELSVPLSDGSF